MCAGAIATAAPASARLRAAEVAFGRVDTKDYLINRRWLVRQGKGKETPFGKVELASKNTSARNASFTEPAGPTDPVVSFFALREPGEGGSKGSCTESGQIRAYHELG